MALTTPTRKPQVNVQLEDAEMARLEQICEIENITRPAELVRVWIRENIKNNDSEAALMAVVREARDSGVDVEAVLAKARRNLARK